PELGYERLHQANNVHDSILGSRTGKNDENWQRIRFSVPISCSSRNVALQNGMMDSSSTSDSKTFSGILNLATHFYRNSGYCSTGMICPLETCLLLRFCVL